MSRHEEPDVAGLYHLHSSNVRSRIGPPGADGDLRPFRFRTYPDAPRTALPGRDFDLPVDFGRLLEARSSTRDFELRTLELEKLGRLLHASYGVGRIKQVEGIAAYARPAPSAGGLYPLELYAVCQSVERLADGVYHYDARAHELEQRRAASLHRLLADLTIGQEMIHTAAVVVAVTAVFHRTMWKYGQRGYRYVWLDAGHLAQNVYLVAGALGLGCVSIGGFFDREVDELLRLPADEQAVYLLCIGHPRQIEAR